MKFGLAENHWQNLLLIAVKPLKDVGCKVFVFGSRAAGSFNPFSDIDLFFTGSAPESLLIKIKSELEDSELPIKVDLVAYTDLPKSFLPSINVSQIEI